jgi:hypothetical protein
MARKKKQAQAAIQLAQNAGFVDEPYRDAFIHQ